MKISTFRVTAIILAILAWGTACKSTQQATNSQTTEDDSPALLTFANGEAVSQAEFERVYAKNNGGPEAVADHTSDQYREYLELYINFKRKVFAAEARGLDTTAAFKQEFGQYRDQLAKPYLSAKEVEEQLVQEAYQRSQHLVNASHILVGVEENASPADTLAAYQKALRYRDSILNHGEAFSAMAQRHSDDPSAANNDGNLGYFTVFNMVYPFETAAFETPVGDISMPVRTRFGYHLLRVNDKIENQGEKRTAHLIVRVGDRYSAKTEEEAEQKINELHQQLESGADFAELVKQYSDDPTTAAQGGDLGTGRLLPEMEDRKLKLSEGEFSDPFKTQFGWHILKVTEVERLADLETAEVSLRQKISRDSRSQLSQAALIARIKRENGFRLNQANFDSLVETLDNRFVQGRWRPDTAQQALYDRELFVIGDDYTATLGAMLDYYRNRRLRFPGRSVRPAAEAVLEQFSEAELIAYEKQRLPEKNPEYRNLLQEYRDGILLFTLMEQKVWKKAVEDTVGLKRFYEANPELFEANTLIEVREYRASDRSVINQVASYLTEGKSTEEIDSLVNQQSSLNLNATVQTYEKGESDLDEAMFEQPVGHVSDIISGENFFRILVIEEKFPPGVKPFDKAKSEAITQYQDHLEATWLEELATRYPVEINEKAFEQLFQ